MERDALVASKGIGTNIEALTRGDDFLGINCYIIGGSLLLKGMLVISPPLFSLSYE